jgi:hypothetical protein
VAVTVTAHRCFGSFAVDHGDCWGAALTASVQVMTGGAAGAAVLERYRNG